MDRRQTWPEPWILQGKIEEKQAKLHCRCRIWHINDLTAFLGEAELKRHPRPELVILPRLGTNIPVTAHMNARPSNTFGGDTLSTLVWPLPLHLPQCKMNTKLSQQRFWTCRKNRFFNTFPRYLHSTPKRTSDFPASLLLMWIKAYRG